MLCRWALAFLSIMITAMIIIIIVKSCDHLLHYVIGVATRVC